MKKIEKMYIIYIAVLTLSIYLCLIYAEYKVDKYCEIYEEQELTATRFSIEGGQKQYSLNGTWVNEGLLKVNCKTFIND